MRFIYKLSIYLGLIVITSSCATGNVTKRSTIPTKNLKRTVVPSGKNYNWRFLGKNNNYEITDEIDENSVTIIGNNVFQFKERKTFINSDPFPEGYTINNVKMRCADQTFAIIASNSYNRQGVLVSSKAIDNEEFVDIVKNSFAFSQYQYVCINKNRTIGY